MSVAPPTDDVDILSPNLHQIADLNIPLTDDFHVPTYINNRFPSQNGLSVNLSSFIVKIDEALQGLDGQIATVVREHRNDTEANNAQLAETRQSIDQLYQKLDSLSAATEQAEKDISKALEPASRFTPLFEMRTLRQPLLKPYVS